MPATKGCDPSAPAGGHNSQAGAVATGAAAVELPPAVVVVEVVERPRLIVRVLAVPELVAAAPAADRTVPVPAVPPVVPPVLGAEVVAVVAGVTPFVEGLTTPDPLGEAVEAAAVVPAAPVVVVLCAAAGAERAASSAAPKHADKSPLLALEKAFIAARPVRGPASCP